MKVSKMNKIVVYKNPQGGKLDVYLNVEGKQYKTTVWPNVDDNLQVTGWGGNLYPNEEEGISND